MKLVPKADVSTVTHGTSANRAELTFVFFANVCSKNSSRASLIVRLGFVPIPPSGCKAEKHFLGQFGVGHQRFANPGRAWCRNPGRQTALRGGRHFPPQPGSCLRSFLVPAVYVKTLQSLRVSAFRKLTSIPRA